MYSAILLQLIAENKWASDAALSFTLCTITVGILFEKKKKIYIYIYIYIKGSYTKDS